MNLYLERILTTETCDSYMPQTTILYEGELFKRGKINASWKKRWFVLNKQFELSYYESATKYGEAVLGTINLLQVQKIEIAEISMLTETELVSIPKYIKILSDNYKCNMYKSRKPYRSFLIYLITPKRTYKLSANNSDSFMSWLIYISNELYSYSDIIFESFLQLNGVNNYYFVLNGINFLKFYNNETRDIFCGYINLNNPQRFALELQTMNKSIQITPKTQTNQKQKVNMYTNDKNAFHKWSEYLSDKNYKNLMGNDNLIESDDETEDDKTLNLSGQNMESIPLSLCKNLASGIEKLILTNNRLSSLEQLKYFPNLETLQLDRNKLEHIADLPQLKNLKTLWLNNNNLTDINALLMIIKQQCPNLEYLSLLFNPLCCAMDENKNKHYRMTLIYHLENLKFLDTETVDFKEQYECIYGADENVEDDVQCSDGGNLFQSKLKDQFIGLVSNKAKNIYKELINSYSI